MPPSGNGSSGAPPLPEPGPKLLFDENLAPRLVVALADLYPGSTHMRNEGLEGSSDTAIWPGVVLAEIYPALFFGKREQRIAKGEGKETEGARRRVFRELLEKTRSEGVEIALTPSAEEWVEAGFFASSDDFDPTLSVVGMLRDLWTGQPLEPPDDPAIQLVEGWILGLTPRQT